MADQLNGVLIVAETTNGDIRASSQELFSIGRELVNSLGGSLTAVVVGASVDQAAIDAAELGADRVLTAEAPEFEQTLAENYIVATEAAIVATNPALVVLSSTTTGRDVAPFLSARHGAPYLVDAVDVERDGDELVVSRPVYQGKLLTKARAALGNRIFLTVRTGSYGVPARQTGRSVEPEPLQLDVDSGGRRVEFVDLQSGGGGATNLESAEIVIIGGRGMGSVEQFNTLYELGDALGGVVGATRAVTDLGWRPHYEQVGQTGKTIAPRLYLGIGVSGAVQHTVGMRNSETIVAINQDPHAPIFKLADFGIVGDLNEIVPVLIRRIREVRG